MSHNHKKNAKQIILATTKNDKKQVKYPPSVIADSKRVLTGAAEKVEKQRLWSLRSVDIGGPWCWGAMNSNSAKQVFERLKTYEAMSWQELREQGCHYIAVGKLDKSARDHLSHLSYDDIDEVYSFRITGKHRAFGVVRDQFIELLWWDPEHQICPSPLK